MTEPTLVDFLLARIAEDEAAAASCSVGRWSAVEDNEMDQRLIDSDTGEDLAVFNYRELRADEALHAARWDPARVLTECESKRRIIELHKPAGALAVQDCTTCGWWSDPYEGPSPMQYPCPTLKALALPYADHPHLREEWRP